MSEFFLYEIENIAKSGVEIKVTGTRLKKCDDDCIRTVRTVCFDFSAHDKVFEDKIAELEKELEEWKEEARVVKKQRDEQLKSFRKGIEPYVDLLHMHETIAELKQHIDELKSKNESLNQSINEITTSRSEWIDKAVEWQQKCEKLESKETETCEKKPKTSDSTPSMEWYENRHQSDCIEINRLNTAIDVLIHKVEYLRQFAGLE